MAFRVVITVLSRRGHTISDVGERRGRGRPTKATPELLDQLVELLAAGVSGAEAARRLGIDKRSIFGWRARGRAGDVRFAELEQRLQRG